MFLEMFKKYFANKRELQLPVLNDSVSYRAAEKRSRILTQDEDVVDKSTPAPMNDSTIASEVTSSSSIPYFDRYNYLNQSGYSDACDDYDFDVEPTPSFTTGVVRNTRDSITMKGGRTSNSSDSGSSQHQCQQQ